MQRRTKKEVLQIYVLDQKDNEIMVSCYVLNKNVAVHKRVMLHLTTLAAYAVTAVRISVCATCCSCSHLEASQKKS